MSANWQFAVVLPAYCVHWKALQLFVVLICFNGEEKGKVSFPFFWTKKVSLSSRGKLDEATIHRQREVRPCLHFQSTKNFHVKGQPNLRKASGVNGIKCEGSTHILTLERYAVRSIRALLRSKARLLS